MLSHFFDGVRRQSYSRAMPELYLMGPDPFPVAPPTEQEAEIIGEFADDPQRLEAYRHEVAEFLTLGMSDLNAIKSRAGDLVLSLRSDLEAELCKSLGSDVKWSEAAPQAPIFARAANNLLPLDRFIRRIFGRDPLNPWKLEISGLSPLLKAGDFLNFAYAAFWHEIIATRDSHRLATTNDALHAIWVRDTGGYIEDDSFLQYEGWKKIYDDSHGPTHTFKWPDEDNGVIQYLAAVRYKDLARFSEEVQNSLGIIGANFTHGKIIDHIEYGRFVAFRRNSSDYYYGYALKNFKSHWDKGSFYRERGFSHELGGRTLYDTKSEIEQKVFRDIISSDLKYKNTVPPSVDAPPLAGAAPSPALSVEDRLASLDEYARANPGEPVSGKVLEFFPEIKSQAAAQKLELPTSPPCRWSSDRVVVDGELENPYQFIMRVYGPWLGKGLTKAHVRNLDDPLIQAFYALQKELPVPPELDLPTKKEWLDREVAAVLANRGESWASSEAARNDRRLREAARRRSKERE